VLTEAERMTAEAGNALLKTLEEPPDNSLLILLSSHPSSLFPTIISRCQTIRFSPLPLKEIKDYLVSRLKLPSAEAQLLSRLSEGRLGKAFSFRDKSTREERKKVLDIVNRLSPADDLEELLKQAAVIGELLSEFKRRLEEKLKKELPREREKMLAKEQLRELKEERKAFLQGESGKKIQEVLDTIINWYRDLLVLREGGEEAWLINADRKEDLRTKAKTISPFHIRNSIDLIEKTKQSLDHHANLRLSLEAMMMKIQEELRNA
jgi:DNA polymerase-3 subunit delta'